jgi:hypothetical protein
MKQTIILKSNAILKEKFNLNGLEDSTISFFETILKRNPKVVYENAEIIRLASISKFIGTLMKRPLINKLKTENTKTIIIIIKSINFICLLNLILFFGVLEDNVIKTIKTKEMLYPHV